MSETRERPIIFSGRMVRAILDGRKTQTRRIAKEFDDDDAGILKRFPNQHGCPHGEPGDILWVREGWRWYGRERDGELEGGFEYRADGEHRLFTDFKDPNVRYREFVESSLRARRPYGWRPSIHMPRWASRLTLEILSVRVERLQDISEEAALAEAPIFTEDANGAVSDSIPVCMFAHLWDGINGKRAPWASNPWVWVIEFRKVSTAGREEAPK